MQQDELCRQLQYTFQDPELLRVALTHRSKHDLNNERMEFLGDSIVNCVIAECLYHQFPHAQEGDLSRWRATLINRDALAHLGREFDLGRYMHLGPGELKSGGSGRQSILSCAMEAVIGAVYLDGGFLVVRECLMRWYAPLLKSITHKTSHKDPKTQLQEELQAKHLPLPVYTVESVSGEAHEQSFVVSCSVSNVSEKVLGSGSSRRKAEQDAAQHVLGKLQT